MKDYYTTKEYAELMGVHPQTVVSTNYLFFRLVKLNYLLRKK